jgi:hypothetical protein
MMQAFQTSYTVYFNKRHGRSGHVFEQRYKALLVDKDNYLLQVSRYIHLDAVSAKLAERPQEYRWCSYGSYLKGKGIIGLKTATVLGQLNGSKSRQLQHRGFSSVLHRFDKLFIPYIDLLAHLRCRVAQALFLPA